MRTRYPVTLPFSPTMTSAPCTSPSISPSTCRMASPENSVVSVKNRNTFECALAEADRVGDSGGTTEETGDHPADQPEGGADDAGHEPDDDMTRDRERLRILSVGAGPGGIARVVMAFALGAGTKATWQTPAGLTIRGRLCR